MAFTRPAQELTDFLTHNPWTPLYPNVILGGGLKLAIWAAIPLLTPYVREICGLATMRIRPAIGTVAIKGAVRALRNPIVERLILPWFGYEMWGYMHNAIRHAPDAGPVPFDHEVGLKLQQGREARWVRVPARCMPCPPRHGRWRHRYDAHRHHGQ